MDKIKCPACGAEVDSDLENCPSCGAPMGTINAQGISGTPIDNKEAINNMLEKANMLVEEGRGLGIGSLEDDPVDQNDDYDYEGIPPLSEDSGQVNVNVNNEEPVIRNAPGVTLYEMDENGNVIPEKKPEPEVEEQNTGKNSVGKSKNHNEDTGDKKKHKTSIVTVFVAVVISLIAGIAMGFFGKMFFFPELPAPSCQGIAEKAVKAVYSQLESDEEIYIAESYVKEFTTSTQCLIRSFNTKSGEVREKWYRVKIENDGMKSVIHIYNQYDKADLDSMAASSDDEERAKAAVLEGYQMETERMIAEMREGNDWVEVNSSLINNSVHPYEIKN